MKFFKILKSIAIGIGTGTLDYIEFLMYDMTYEDYKNLDPGGDGTDDFSTIHKMTFMEIIKLMNKKSEGDIKLMIIGPLLLLIFYPFLVLPLKYKIKKLKRKQPEHFL